MESAYDEGIAQCQQEIKDLLQRRQNIDQQLAARQQMLAALVKLKHTMAERGKLQSLARMMRKESPVPPEGLAEQCRRILRLGEGVPMTPFQVKEQLEALGFDFSQYKTNPLSSIHTTLRRIAKGKVFEEVKVLGQGAAYKWIPPPP